MFMNLIVEIFKTFIRRSMRIKVFQNFIVFLISIIFITAIAEVALRLLFPEILGSPKKYAEGRLCHYDPLIGWIGEPKKAETISFKATDMAEMNVNINAEGFWDGFHRTSKFGAKRILFLGDSFTAGYGIPKDKRFTNVLMDRLPFGYEILNMGIWGYSTDQELLVLKEKGLKYNPDILIVVMFIDDIHNNNLLSVHDGLYLKPKFSVNRNGLLKLVNSPVPNNHSKSALFNFALTRFYKLRDRINMGKEFIERGWYSVFDKLYLNQGKYDLSFNLLKELKKESQENQIKFMLVLVPIRAQLYESQLLSAKRSLFGIPLERFDLSLPQKVLAEFCKKEGIPVLDLLPAFKRQEKANNFYFQHDLHWNEDGHSYAAEQILNFLHKHDYLS